MLKISDIRDQFKLKLAKNEFVTDKTGVKTIEIIGSSFLADEPVIFGTLNTDYIERELKWYCLRSLNINDIPAPIPEIWRQIASRDGQINSNYGWCIWSGDNGNQYDNTLLELQRNPDSRRAVMIYTRPKMHYDYNRDGMSDFICTNAVQYLIRDDRLCAIVQMRSNDAVFGYKNDYAWQRYVLEHLAADLHVSSGDIYWNASSLHVYERHFELINNFG